MVDTLLGRIEQSPPEAPQARGLTAEVRLMIMVDGVMSVVIQRVAPGNRAPK